MKTPGRIILPLLIACASVPAARAQNHPFPQHVLYASGSILPTSHPQTQLDADVRAFYDYWKQTYLKTAGATADGRTLYRVAFGKNAPGSNATVSEGQGYGMLIVPLMAGYDPAARAIFDGLYEFAKAHPSPGEPRLMDWKIPRDAGADGSSAFDGDADIAHGLLLAHAQWGSGGTVNYSAAANTWLAGILAATIGNTSRLPTLGDWAAPDTGKQYEPRSSDLMPAHFRAWARHTGNPVWNTVAANSSAVVTAIQANYSADTGLIPDFMIGANPLASVKPAGPGFLEGPHDGHYYYNAGRVPWRLGVDFLLNNNATSKAQVSKIATWMKTHANGDAANIRAGYKLDGTNITGNNYTTTFFISPIGVAAMSDSANQAFLNSIYTFVRTTHEDYFEDTVNLLCLIAMSGNYWDPTTIGEQASLIRRHVLPPDGQIQLESARPERILALTVNPAATRYGLTLEQTADFSTWTTIATRSSGTTTFQPTAGVSILSQANPIRIRDNTAPSNTHQFYRARID
ncbi:glycosyl hydrolase family 8 [Luteolibacter soli]|uniref:cellulase n=1 Tax=Luteolibacter soli TaxID=3135280 RepID=A0ABU9B1M9_9BACT